MINTAEIVAAHVKSRLQALDLLINLEISHVICIWLYQCIWEKYTAILQAKDTS